MENLLSKYTLSQGGDDVNALQCELIATKRTNDALVLENNKLRIDLKELSEQFSCFENEKCKQIEQLENTLTLKTEEYERNLEESKIQCSNKIDKIKEYTMSLLNFTRHKYHTQINILRSDLKMQQSMAEKARLEVEDVWQKRMDAYRNEITDRFNGLLESVASIQENKRLKEQNYLNEIESYKNVIENLKLENLSSKEKIENGKITLEQFKENNSLLREKLIRKEETVNELQITIKMGIEERNQLQNIINEMKKKKTIGSSSNGKNDNMNEINVKKNKKKNTAVVEEKNDNFDQDISIPLLNLNKPIEMNCTKNIRKNSCSAPKVWK